jgi:DNA (cytosine-5)-methyltransferase 1
MKVYYNEVEPFLCEWLRRLCHARLIPPGDIDCRDIAEVQPEDLNGYDQCHFFSGIGLWTDALQRAGWPDEWPVWTGSCPCQPFSIAGKMQGTADKRHLWPEFLRLIAERRPPACFGEQVASPLGRKWLAGVRADLEGMGYACGAADLCSAGVGAPHIRQRLHWVAYANHERFDGQPVCLQPRRSFQANLEAARCGANYPEGLANSLQPGRPEGRSWTGDGQTAGCGRTAEGLAHSRHEQAWWPATAGETQGGWALGDVAGCGARAEGLGDAGVAGLARREGSGRDDGVQLAAIERAGGATVSQWNGPTTVVECRDGFRRIPAQPALFPLVNGDKGRMGRLRAYGNAISPILAAKFVEAAMSCRP